MKKFFTLIAVALMSMSAMAQNNAFDFCYADGTVIPSGSTIETRELAQALVAFNMFQVEGGVYAKNNRSIAIKGNLVIDIKKLDEGSTASCCFGEQCIPYPQAGKYNIEETIGASGISDLRCHVVSNGTYYNVPITLTLQDASGFSPIDCSTITVNFIYDELSMGVNEINKDVKAVESYDLQGRKTNANGLRIVKMSDGSVRKVLR